MAVTFDNLNPNAPIFRELVSNAPSWWKRFVNDPALYIEIRKGNQINVYFEGGRIARIHYSKMLQVFTHYKYLGHPKPVKGSLYEECSSDIGQIVDNVIERVKAEYSQKNSKDGPFDKEKWSEKYIQGTIIVKNKEIHLDSEFAYTDQESDNRIDLIRCDNGIVSFLELKRMDDSRMLHESDESPEIIDQMKRYEQFILKYKDCLLSYYQKVYDIKKGLNLPVPTVRPISINLSPHLLIFDRWEKWSEKRETHRTRVETILKREGIQYSIITEL